MMWFIILLWHAEASLWAQAGPPGQSSRPMMAEVVSSDRQQILLRFADGQEQKIARSPEIRVVKQSKRTVKDLAVGANVLVRGRKDGSTMIAEAVILTGQNGPKGPMGEGGLLFGKIKSLNPFSVLSDDKKIDVSIVESTLVAEETAADFDALRPGNTVLAIGPPGRPFKIVMIESNGKPPIGQKSSSGTDRPMAPRPDGGGPQGPGLEVRDKDASERARRPPRELPMPPPATKSNFDLRIVQVGANSAFGFKDANMLRPDIFSWYDGYGAAMNDLGATWLEPAASFGISWQEVQQRDPSGAYSAFHHWDRYDRMIQHAQSYNLHLSMILHATQPEPGRERGFVLPAMPSDMAGFAAFVRATVERYDGDGMEDMPGLLYPIRCWKIEDEPMAPRYFGGTGADYAEIVRVAYDAAKAADPGCTVILAMIRGYTGLPGDAMAFMEDFFATFARKGTQPKWDVMDHHWMITDPNVSRETQYREIKRYLQDVRTAEAKVGVTATPFWVMETAGITDPEQAHAVDLFKRYVYCFSLGVAKVFWSGLAERTDGVQTGEIDPFQKVTLIDAKGGRKLAYTTYQNMAQNLEGFDPQRTRTLMDESGLFACEFTRADEPMWVAWNDASDERSATIQVPPRVKKVIVTEAVPRLNSGGEVHNASSLFQRQRCRASKGKIAIRVGQMPVIITIAH